VELRARLLAVNGVGPETADDILLYAFERPVFVIDAYTRRLFARLGLASGDEAYDELRIGVETALPGEVGWYQEFHALVVAHGKQRCRPKPACPGCPILAACGFQGAVSG
jgi:endonuclease-3 related protein